MCALKNAPLTEISIPLVYKATAITKLTTTTTTTTTTTASQ